MVYLSRCYRDCTSAGNKAKTDNEQTMDEMGFRNVGLPQRIGGNGIFIFFYDLVSVLKAVATLRRGDVLVLQYPVKKYFSFLCHMAHAKGAHVVALIHDLGSFRRRKLTVPQEIGRLSNADYIIASNEKMKEWLVAQGLKKPVGALGFFDYRSPAEPEPYQRQTEEPYHVVYAGSLAMRKNAFFLQLPPFIHGFELHIFGNGDKMPSLKEEKSFVFHGFQPADAFIRSVGGDFGLVWDGDSLDACTGSFGEYLKVNSPHKVSFYLRAGLPVIIWKEAALAPLIEQEGVGITISSLRDLASRLAAITPEEYAAMRERVKSVADRLAKGAFFRRAAPTLINTLLPNLSDTVCSSDGGGSIDGRS